MYVCPLCGKKISTYGTFKQHLIAKHSAELKQIFENFLPNTRSRKLFIGKNFCHRLDSDNCIEILAYFIYSDTLSRSTPKQRMELYNKIRACFYDYKT